MNPINTVLFVLSIGLCVSAQKFGIGSCPHTTIITNFDVTQYLGKWYEIAKYPTLFQNGDCTEAVYGPINELGLANVMNKELQNGGVVAVRGYAKQELRRSDLKVTLQVPLVGMQESDYNVLATDYSSYALVHACRQVLHALKFEFVWILSRDRSLTPEAAEKVNTAMDVNRLDKSSLAMTRQTGCPDLDSLPYKLIA